MTSNIELRPPSRRRFVAHLATGAAALAAPALVRAQAKPLTIFLTVPPGTSSDTLARMLGERMGAKLNRTVVVESRSGAGGLVAINAMRQLDADGSTLMMAPNSAVSLLPLFATKPEETWSSTDDDEVLNDVLDMVDSESVTYEFTPV